MNYDISVTPEIELYANLCYYFYKLNNSDFQSPLKRINMNIKNKTNVFMVLSFFCLTACSEQGNMTDEQIVQKRQQIVKSEPTVVDLGIVDGCNIKYYVKKMPNTQLKQDIENLEYHSFYIAKCDDTTTTTDKVGGKFKHDEATIIKNK